MGVRELVRAFGHEYAGWSLKKNVGFAGLFTLGSIGLLVMAYLKPALPFGLATSPLEAWAVISGALCVWLTVVQSIWNFPFSLVSCGLFFELFREINLPGDMYLQLFFIALSLHGWYWWMVGGEKRNELPVSRAPILDWFVVLAIVTLGTPILIYYVTGKGSAPFLDAYTTAGSVAAQFLLNRKRIETWFLWILVDVIYVPLYVFKGVNLTAILYGAFLVMCVFGLRDWWRSFKSSELGVA